MEQSKKMKMKDIQNSIEKLQKEMERLRLS